MRVFVNDDDDELHNTRKSITVCPLPEQTNLSSHIMCSGF